MRGRSCRMHLLRGQREDVDQNVSAADGCMRGLSALSLQPSAIRKGRRFRIGPSTINPGSDLLSHTLSHAVPSAVESLTSVFGMGTGVTPLL